MDNSRGIFEIIKQIARWIWRIILSLFLVFCIIFQAPLKLLALIAIFLLTCTVLPLRYRKWFWATAGIVILGLVLWVLLPENDKGWKPFTFDDELAALEAKNKIPYEENAAVIYDLLLADYSKSDFEPNCLDDEFTDCQTSKTFWRKKDYPQVAKWIKNHEDTIYQLMQASDFEKCKFDVTAKSQLLPEIERLGAFRRWAQLLSRTGNNDIGEGRVEQGLKKYYRTIQMGKHICQQSFLIEILTGLSLESLAINRLNDFVITGNPNKKQLNAIGEIINGVKCDWQSDWPRVLDYEKLLFKNMVGVFYEVNAKGQYRFIRHPENAIKILSPEFVQVPPKNYFQQKLVKAGSIIHWFLAPATPQKLAAEIDRAYQGNYEMADPNFNWSVKPPEVKYPLQFFKFNYKYLIEICSLMNKSSYYTIHDLYLREDSQKKGALLLIAVRRYKNKNGIWPENLAEVADLTEEENFIDSANGQSFVYKLTGDNFTLYGKGKNGIDEGGQKGYCKDDKNDDINIWPITKCKKESAEEPNDIQKD